MSWRQVNVIFIPKPGKPDYTERRAFRPISLMSVLFKTLERLTLWHIEEANLSRFPMHKDQFGFRKGVSTDHALSKAVNIIEKGLNQGKYVLGVFCDISGAFDNVNLLSITNSMRDRGIDEKIIHWYDHFLRARKCSSTLGNSMAIIQPGKGAPQGGVLSAIIAWNLVFDDFLKLYDGTAIESIGFADDGSLLITGIDPPTMVAEMQRALNHAGAWAADNGLAFCPKKTNAILFTRKHKSPTLTPLRMNGKDIPYVKETKMLGVIIDSKLSWTPHIHQRVASCKRALMQLRPLLGKMWSPEPKYTRWLYKGVILPMLTYGCVVWSNAIKYQHIKELLGTLQRLGLISVAKVRRGTPTAALELLYDAPPLHLVLHELALNTFLRLGEQQKPNWTPTTGHHGHIQRLRENAPVVLDDDVIAPMANWEPPYEITIEPDLRPQTAGIIVYTDGSLMNERSGAGAYIEVNGYPLMTTAERLQPCTVFQAALIAIQIAAEIILQRNSSRDAIHFHVDSQSALYALNAAYIVSSTVAETKAILAELSLTHRVTLQWVKAHVGIPGNEQADLAAKAGSEANRGPRRRIKQSRTAQKSSIRDQRNTAWKRHWDEIKDKRTKLPSCRQSKLFMPSPDPIFWQCLKKLCHTKVSRAVRFITGHCFMNRHNMLLEHGYAYVHEEPDEVLCRLCCESQAPETPEHLLCHCPITRDLRRNLFYQLLNRREELAKPPPFSNAVLQFIDSPAIISIERTTLVLPNE